MSMLSHSDYARCFQALLSASREHDVTVEWIAANLGPRFSGKQGVRVASLGTATGEFDAAVIDAINATSFDYQFIEPNPAHVQVLRERYGTTPSKHTFTIVPKNFDAATDLGAHFDLILMAHVLYYVSGADRAEVIGNAMRHLAPGGILLIVHQTQLGIHQIQKFYGSVSGQEIAQTCATSDIRASCPASVREFLVPTALDVTPIVTKLPGGADLLSFFLERDVTTIDPRLVAAVTLFISDTSYMRNGRYYLFHPVGLMMIGESDEISNLQLSQYGKELP